MRGHRSRIRARPPKKAAVPFAFCFRAKKRSVFCGPMIIVRPIRKRICGRVGQLGRTSAFQGGRSYVSHGKPATDRQLHLERLVCGKGGTYMARSKKSITPPMRKKPPEPASAPIDHQCARARIERKPTTRAENDPNLCNSCQRPSRTGSEA